MFDLSTPFRRLILLVTISAGIGATAIAVMLVKCITRSLRAEGHLQATLFTIDLIDQYVADNGDWPRSWSDLERVHPRFRESAWPSDADWVRESVYVDFRQDLNSIDTTDVEHFNAIKAMPPAF